MVEPWLRGTLGEFDAVRRQVLHALELAEEDCLRWAGGLSDAQMSARPFGMASVGFHLRHIARSLDRLLTYAEGSGLSETQRAALKSELDEVGGAQTVLEELVSAVARAKERVTAILPETFDEPRGVGRELLPSTVGGLLVHCAEHTQRHVGQVVTLAQVVRAVVSR